MLAENIRDQLSRATADAPVSTYIESTPPISWRTISTAGWDLAGIADDDDSATLRDLVEIGRTWGQTLVQLPLITSLMTKRHSPAAAEYDGATTLGVPLRRLKAGSAYIPFGEMAGIGVAGSLGGTGTMAAEEPGVADDYAPSLSGVVGTTVTRLTGEARRELAVVWAAEAAGRAQTVLKHAVEFVQEREQFNKPVGSFQAVKHHLANAHIASEMAETSAVWASLTPEESGRAVSQAFREAQKAMHSALQTFGGLGFTWEMGVHFSLRHVATLRELALGVLDE